LGYQLSNGTDGETVASPAGAVNGAAIGEAGFVVNVRGVAGLL
jgi:hypothetical protein